MTWGLLLAPARMSWRGELLYSQSQPVTALFILEPGAVFGEMTLVGQRMYDNYAEAIKDAAVCRLSVEEVERYLLSDPRIAIRISRLLGKRWPASKNASRALASAR